MHYCTT